MVRRQADRPGKRGLKSRACCHVEHRVTMPELTQSNKDTPFTPSARELMALPGKKALDVILESPMPARLVQSLAEEDFFWLVQDIGPEDAIQMLARASNEQWQYLLDVELWDRDQVAHHAVHRWMGLLMKADPKRFVVWALDSNVELLEFYFFKSMEVRIRQQDESPSDFGDGFFSLDGTFYIRIRDNKVSYIIRQFLEYLAAHDVQRYHEILLEMGGLVPAETEENMYRLRNMRLAEKGFLPFEEAVGIYQSLSPRALTGKKHETVKLAKHIEASSSAPVSNALLIRQGDPFHKALLKITDNNHLEGIQVEFAALCNQIMSADSLVARGKEDLAAIVRKACGYLDIAIEKIAGTDPQKAVDLLTGFSLGNIFRVGYGAGMELKWRAERWVTKSWFVSQGLDFGFWGNHWQSILEGLLRKRPLFFAGYSKTGEPFREFRGLKEIAECHQALDQAMGMDQLLRLVFLHAQSVQTAGISHPVTYKNLLMTKWARSHLELVEQIKPVSIEQLRLFFRDLWGQQAKPYCIRQDMKESFMHWLTRETGLEVHQIQGLGGKTLDGLFDELEQEYGAVSLEDLDPRYVKHFLVAT